MTTETALRDVLHRAADAVADDDVQLERVVRRGRRRRARTRGSVVAAVAVVAVTAAIAGVTLDTPGSAPYDRSTPIEHADVVLFLCGETAVGAGSEPACDAPATDDDISQLRGALALDDAVAEVRQETPQQAYERFAELFADQPDLVDSVTPEELPGSLRLTLVDGAAAADEVVRHYRGFDGVADAVAAEGDDGAGSG